MASLRAAVSLRGFNVSRLGATERPLLADICVGSSFLGTSLILRRGGRLLYGMRPSRAEGARRVVELTGIGGGMEPQDASLAAGVLREVREEIERPVLLLPCHETLVVRGPGQVKRVELRGAARPVAVVFRRYGTPPHQPWHTQNQGESCLAIFLAELQGKPRPAAELPALVRLSPQQVVATAREDVLLSDLLDAGAQLVERQTGSCDGREWVRLTDSQEALVLGLGAEALPFYQGLASAGTAPPRM